MNQHRGVTIGAACGIIALMLAYIGYSMFAGNSAGAAGGSGAPRAYYTDDDGATYFADAADKVTPFDHNGKQAVLAHVFSCDGGSNKFVGWLERFSPEGKKKQAEFAKNPAATPEILAMLKEVKPPKTGDKDWVNVATTRAAQIQTPRCPGGKPGDPIPVMPD
jgi:hypothetical protein